MLLQFPIEPFRFRTLRDEALIRFRDVCRRPVVRRFGAQAADLGVFVTHCERCGESNGRLGGLGDLPRGLSLSALTEELCERAERRDYGWRASTCVHCGAAWPGPVVALFGRYLPESGVDLHLELVFGAGRVVRVEHHRSEGGQVRTVRAPDGPLAFVEIYGAPLSVRNLWPAFVAQNLYSEVVTTLQVQPGYHLGLRPFTDHTVEAEAWLTAFEPQLERLRQDRNYDAVSFLREREIEDIPVPHDDSYHVWLSAFGDEIAQGLIDPFIIADTDTFIALLAERAAHHGLVVHRDSGASTLHVRVVRGDLDLRLNVGPRFFRVIHEGLSFHEGLRRHFERDLWALGQAAGLPAVLQSELPGHRIEIVDGGTLVVAPPGGGASFSGNLVKVATAHDYHEAAGLRELVREVSTR